MRKGVTTMEDEAQDADNSVSGTSEARRRDSETGP